MRSFIGRPMRAAVPLYAMRTSSTSAPSASSTPASTEADRIVAALEKDADMMQCVLRKMDPESRRRLVIAGGAAEWFGKEKIEEEVALADLDRDKFISPKDFENWFHSAIKRFPDTAKVAAATASGNQAAANSAESSASLPVPLSALVIIAIEAALPFVGFGFLDNAVMLIAGDAIDHTLGAALHLSVMASAAMGNVVSGMLGMQVHGAVEKLVQKLNLPVPILSDQQRSSQRVFMAGHIGGTVGIAIGLTLGMLPLLFISNDDDDKAIEHAFTSIDTSKDGLISAAELREALGRVGITIDASQAQALVIKYSGQEGKGLNLEDFKKLAAELKRSQKREQKQASA